MCVSVCAHAYTQMYAYMCGGHRSSSGVLSQDAIPVPCLWRQDLSPTSTLLIQPAWLATEPQGSTCFISSSFTTRIVNKCALFVPGFWGLNMGPHVFMINTLRIELASPPPPAPSPASRPVLLVRILYIRLIPSYENTHAVV